MDGPRIAAAALIVALTGAMSVVPPPSWEQSLFRAVNGLLRYLDYPLWFLQQAGMAMAIPAAALAFWFVVAHWRPPVGLVFGGIILGWAAAKGIKAIVGRGRPSVLLEDVVCGPDGPLRGIGFPSGHAVAVFTIAVVFSRTFPDG